MKFVLGLPFLLSPVMATFSAQPPEECKSPASLEQAIRGKPFAKVFGETGTWFEQHGNQSCSLAALQRAVQLEPQSGQAHYTLGASRVRAQQLSTAAAEFRLALKYQPGLAIAHSSLGSVLMDPGKSTEAEAEFREGLRLDPQLQPALVGLGMVRANQGDDHKRLIKFRAVAHYDHRKLLLEPTVIIDSPGVESRPCRLSFSYELIRLRSA